MAPDRFEGCLLGLALGDAFGAPHEGGPVERLLWMAIGRTRDGRRRFTDDTQMSLDLAESLIAQGRLDADDVARRFATGYRWSRGYGPGTAKVLRRIRRGAAWEEAIHSGHAGGSFGNGGAMRAPVIGLFYARRSEELVEAARLSARITHAHPLGIDGAVAIAAATASALAGDDPSTIAQAAFAYCTQEPLKARLAVAAQWLRDANDRPANEVARGLGNSVAAIDSCATALYLALRFGSRSLEDMLAFAARVGGDVDSIGAMAGAVWGAMRGSAALPEALLARLEQRERIAATAAGLFRHAP